LQEFVKIFKFDHENLCSYLEVFLDTTVINEELDVTLNSNKYYIIIVVMPLYTDGDLYYYVKNNKLNEEEVLDFSIQISKGINYLHKNNISHRYSLFK
jgi:serine/threonine protein kinase